MVAKTHIKRVGTASNVSPSLCKYPSLSTPPAVSVISALGSLANALPKSTNFHFFEVVGHGVAHCTLVLIKTVQCFSQRVSLHFLPIAAPQNWIPRQ
jgi:hypothetical protein